MQNISQPYYYKFDEQELERLWLEQKQSELFLIEELPEDYELKALSELQDCPSREE